MGYLDKMLNRSKENKKQEDNQKTEDTQNTTRTPATPAPQPKATPTTPAKPATRTPSKLPPAPPQPKTELPPPRRIPTLKETPAPQPVSQPPKKPEPPQSKPLPSEPSPQPVKPVEPEIQKPTPEPQPIKPVEEPEPIPKATPQPIRPVEPAEPIKQSPEPQENTPEEKMKKPLRIRDVSTPPKETPPETPQPEPEKPQKKILPEPPKKTEKSSTGMIELEQYTTPIKDVSTPPKTQFPPKKDKEELPETDYSEEDSKLMLPPKKTTEEKEKTKKPLPPKPPMGKSKKQPPKPPSPKKGPAPPPKIKAEDVPEGLKKEVEESLPPGKKLIDSYGLCRIYELPSKEKIYVIPVPRPHGPERQIINTVKEAATRLITISPDEIKETDKRRGFFKKRILEIIEASPELGVPPSKMDFYAETIMREMIGYGSLDLFLQDDKLEDIMINGPNKATYAFHRNHGMLKTNLIFGSDDRIKSIIERIARDVGRRIDIKDPLLDARLPDGSRVNATIPPISLEGATITVRQFREDPFTFIDLIKMGTMSAELAAFFWVAVEGISAKPANILVSGGTASGKTTTLNVLASFIPNTERIITIEDTAEIKLPMEHWIRFETRPPGIEGGGEINMDTLLKNTLRMRPDRVIVGEIRGPEAFTLFTAMNTGHDGSLGTVHANNAKETVVRLKSPPMKVPRTMLSALDFVIVQKRIHDRRKGIIRRISEVAELTGMLEGEPKFNYLFTWDPATDTYSTAYENSAYLQELSKFTGMSNTAIREEIKTREKYINDIVEGGRKPIEEVCAKIHKLVG